MLSLLGSLLGFGGSVTSYTRQFQEKKTKSTNSRS